jgi:ATP-dependent 26S proteasome regulatory subunit
VVTPRRDLVLAGDQAQRIRDDVASFVGARDLYARYRVPYKRGVLLTGPPGNGKTHCVRAIIKDAKLPTLYVKSFEVFLNELDGVAADTGILTLATTNHAERLDPALLERPSRFDRKYLFDLPGLSERQRYIALWRSRLEHDMRIDDAAATRLIEGTDGFSYAYLKEPSSARWCGGSAPRATCRRSSRTSSSTCARRRSAQRPRRSLRARRRRARRGRPGRRRRRRPRCW